MKRIVYVVQDYGIDGRDKPKVLYASFIEQERDSMLNADPSKAWRSKGEQIIDPSVAYKQALAKLDGIDRLVLGIAPWPITVIPSTLLGT